MKPDGFAPAPKDIEVTDIWPAGTFGPRVQKAYDRLAAAGRIVPVSVTADEAFGKVVVRYMADVPAEWIRAELAEARRL